MKPPRLNGLSQKLLESHYENNYGGAVRRLNAIDDQLADLNFDIAPGFEINGLKREQLVAADSVILHEIYFDILGGVGGNPEDAGLAAALKRDFGSVERWRAEFVAMGKALGGGAGWVLLCWSERLGRLINHWAADHAHGLAGAVPILALDMYEHAYHIDFGSNAGAYVDAFMANLDWNHIAARFERATVSSRQPTPKPNAVTATELEAALRDPKSAPIVLDVRLPEDRLGNILPATPWRDMKEVDQWAKHLPKDRDVVVYCMYGFWVSEDTAEALRNLGINAQILDGSISAWRATGLPTDPL
ncbi:MAG: Fe-Mn family superoxide dismutase [Alphaproteobacteria bacterium]|nr:Fe-Mn family superoxide dismutase [Alphaproteobacteria bacterium]